MKKIVILVSTIVMASASAFAGGVITNTNQSTQFVRTVSRSASTDDDAVYFNPAATAHFSDGVHLSYSHQVCIQKRVTTDDFPTLNNHEYEGNVFVPAFPNLYATWKKNNLALFFGFGPVGGGGSAEYEKGLASFERQISMMPAMVSQMGQTMGLSATAYDVNINFTGTSILYGGRVGGSYSFLDDKLAVSLGIAAIYQKNAYKGSIKDIRLNPTCAALGMNGDMIPATTFFTQVATALSTMNPTMAATAGAYANAVADKEVDAVQTGFGLAPIIGFSFKPDDKLNIGVKYEGRTKMELTNDTKKDDTGMFTDDSTFRKDIPAILSLGIGANLTEKFRISTSYTYYFDKNADWGGREDFLDKNTMDVAGNLEYDVIPLLTLSAGYSRSMSGTSADFQTDMDYALSSNAFGMGGRLNLSERLKVDFGFMYVAYDDVEKTSTFNNVSHTESFDRTNKSFSLGVSYAF
ncbi:MAG: outer membrane protein transport protein [Bacteroidales bacterium]|nr:outer membrane protein transport protein [Bacteroidales bacterium]